MSDRYDEVDIAEYNLSASQIKTFSGCPKQYEFRYIQGKPATKQDSVYAKMGTRVHEAIDEIIGGDEHPPFDQRQIVRNILREQYVDADGPSLPESEYERGLKCVQKAGDVLHKFDPNIRGTELRKEYEISRPDMSTGVTAKMDVVTEGEVWDWKTGRIRPEDTNHEETIQGSVYMAAYLAMYGEPPDAVRFVYLSPDARKNTDSKEDGACMRTVEPNDENWQYMLKRAKRLQHAKETGEFPAKPGDQCYWCSYEFWCGETPVGMGNVEWEDY